MGVRIVTDTSCDLPSQMERQLLAMGVTIVPFIFSFGLEQLPDKSISMEEFVARANKQWPTTSVPSTGTFVQAFAQHTQAGEQVVCITVTSNHSATYSAAVAASRQFAPGEVTVVDSRSLSLGQGILVLAAARAAGEGQSPEQIAFTIDELRSRLHLYITLDTVEYLVRGGRASRMSGIVAGLLRIRPILTLIGGELTLLDRVRGRKAAKRKIIDLAAGHFPAEHVGVAHIACEDEARALLSVFAAQTGYAEDKISLIETGMVLATHAGPGTLGIAVVSRPTGTAARN